METNFSVRRLIYPRKWFISTNNHLCQQLKYLNFTVNELARTQGNLIYKFTQDFNEAVSTEYDMT